MMSNDIKTYSVQKSARELDSVINNMMWGNLESAKDPNTPEVIDEKAIPFATDKPLPQDMNVVSGTHLSDINRLQLELKATQIGAKSQMWIYGADAAILGLELKDVFPKERVNARRTAINFDSDPFVCYGNVSHNLASNAKTS